MYRPDGPSDTAEWTVDDDEGHHLQRVVRAQVGDRIQVFDGRGHEWASSIVAIGRGTVTCAPATAMSATGEPPVSITLVMGVLKGDQMDTVMRDATVMGVTRIAPVSTDHVTVPARAWREPAALARWQRVAVAAARQCRRAVVPDILPVQPLQEAWPQGTVGLACLEPGVASTTGPAWMNVPRPQEAYLLVGPEGGWSPAEVAWCAARSAHPVRLGPRTLRAEVTPMVALATLWTHWGW